MKWTSEYEVGRVDGCGAAKTSYPTLWSLPIASKTFYTHIHPELVKYIHTHTNCKWDEYVTKSLKIYLSIIS